MATSWSGTELTVEVSVQYGFDPDLQPDWMGAMPAAGQWQAWIEQWLIVLAPHYSPIGAYEVDLRLTTDDDIHALNAAYRQRDRPTDVLSFATLDEELPPPDVLEQLPLALGDIIVSLDTAQTQAQDRGHSLAQELVWLVAHGLLHLLEWDHPTDERLQQMLSQQAALLQAIHMPINEAIWADEPS